MESSLCVSIEALFYKTSLLHFHYIQQFPSLRFEEMGIFLLVHINVLSVTRIHLHPWIW